MSRIASAPQMPWTIDQSIEIDDISLDEMKLIFSQAEKRLDGTIKEGEGIASKSMSMITLMAGLLIALSGYIISTWKGLSTLSNKDLVAILGCIYIVALLVYVINNIMTYNYSIGGSRPENLMDAGYFDDVNSAEKALLAIYIGEIENYNWRIANNENLNGIGWRRFRNSVYLFLLFPFILALLYGVLEWLRRDR